MPTLEDLSEEYYDLNHRADAARKLGDRRLATSLATEAQIVLQEIHDLQKVELCDSGIACSDRMCGAQDCPTCYPELRTSQRYGVSA